MLLETFRKDNTRSSWVQVFNGSLSIHIHVSINTGRFSSRSHDTSFQTVVGRAGGIDSFTAKLTPKEDTDGFWNFPSHLKLLDLTDNDIGCDGLRTFTYALHPKQNPNGKWVFNESLNTLILGRGSTRRAYIDAEVYYDQHGQNLPQSDVDNNICIIQHIGAEALAKAMEPMKQPDGTWVSVCVDLS